MLTSPNMEVFPVHPFGKREIRMRQDRHFGEDDPLYQPQPFDTRVPHLAFIRHASGVSQVLLMLWFVLEDCPEHFTRLEGADQIHGLGRIHVPFYDVLKGIFSNLKRERSTAVEQEKYSQGRKRVENDLFLKTYIQRLTVLFCRLELPATFEECASAWCVTQRTVLEFEARLVWLIDVCETFYDASRRHLPLRNVVGALTASFDVADSLFRVSFFPVF